MRRGFGSSTQEHGRLFVGLLQDCEGHMTSAERVLRGGDCEAGVESTLAAERLYGEARCHYSAASGRVPGEDYERLVRATKRLNFLRQALKACVRG
jgi:hypothetical protein